MTHIYALQSPLLMDWLWTWWTKGGMNQAYLFDIHLEPEDFASFSTIQLFNI